MIFNSIEFILFLPIVFLLYWFATQRNLKLQNFLLLVASYVFYGWWDWRFLSLIVFSSFVDFFIGTTLGKTKKENNRKILLALSLVTNLGLLGGFKYYNFFVESFVDAFTLLGKPLDIKTLKIILPVGISFYTFQTLSYTIDVYRKQLKPTGDIIAFMSFVSFFPQLVAGPIERASNLLPQFLYKRKFDYNKAVDGLRQILWGLFKKVVIADGCAEYANLIFNNHEDYTGATLVLGAFLFSLQIYGDFSGYSDIAIGVSRLFGFNLMKNFAFPYFSRDIAEFWRRWHISLSTWFRDYLYIPLGGSRVNTLLQIRNVFIIFIVSGFWHGSKWTFVIWGALNALYFLPMLLLKQNRNNTGNIAEGRWLPSLRDTIAIITTFSLTTFAWIFFRAKDLSHAWSYIEAMIMGLLVKKGYIELYDLYWWKIGKKLPLLILLFITIEWLGRHDEFALERVSSALRNKNIRYVFYYILLFAIILLSGKEQQFIYFQF